MAKHTYFKNPNAIIDVFGIKAYDDLNKLFNPCCGPLSESICAKINDCVVPSGITANNGLTLTGSNIQLGGALTESATLITYGASGNIFGFADFASPTNFIFLGDTTVVGGGPNSINAVLDGIINLNSNAGGGLGIVAEITLSNSNKSVESVYTEHSFQVGHYATGNNVNPYSNIYYGLNDGSGNFVSDLGRINVSKDDIHGYYWIDRTGVSSLINGWDAKGTYSQLIYNGNGGDQTTGTLLTLDANGLKYYVSNSTKFSLDNNGSVSLKAGQNSKLSNKNANYLITSADYLISVDCSGGIVTITLPASPTNGDMYIIKDSKGNSLINNITLAGNGNTIDGTASKTLSINYTSITVIWDATNSSWLII